MAEITTDGDVNAAHLGYLLDGELWDEGLRVTGPRGDGTTTIRAHGVGEDRLREVLGQLDPAWTPPDPGPSPVDQARAIRDNRSAAVASPTAQLLDAVSYYLAEERAQPEPDARWVCVLEALRQLGLKGVADEAVEKDSAAYAEIYTTRISGQ